MRHARQEPASAPPRSAAPLPFASRAGVPDRLRLVFSLHAEALRRAMPLAEVAGEHAEAVRRGGSAAGGCSPPRRRSRWRAPFRVVPSPPGGRRPPPPVPGAGALVS